MRHFAWIIAGAAIVGGGIGFTSMDRPAPERMTSKAADTAIAVSEIGSPIKLEAGASGRALAAAAFGLSALQPETYDGELVLDIIDASHLDTYEKRELTDNLKDAEAGRADLVLVLAEVRVALAVE